VTAPTWQILPDPITQHLPSVLVTHAETGRDTAVGFHGRGMLLPFRRDEKSDFANGTGEALVRSAVTLVLGTRLGELPWRGEFGTLIDQLRLRSNSPALAEIARATIQRAFRLWLPRVLLRSLTAIRDQRGYSLEIRIVWDVLDESGTRVVISGLETTIALG